MSLSDPIGDMIARIKNASLRNYKKVQIPSSKFKMKIADVLKSVGYIIDCKVINDEDSSVFLRQFKENKKITEWLIEWKKNIKKQKLSSKEVLKILKSSNPNFIPRNHLIENAITLATKDNDFTEMKKLLSILTKPYSNQSSNKDYMRSPKPEEKVTQTFCGT